MTWLLNFIGFSVAAWYIIPVIKSIIADAIRLASEDREF